MPLGILLLGPTLLDRVNEPRMAFLVLGNESFLLKKVTVLDFILFSVLETQHSVLLVLSWRKPLPLPFDLFHYLRCAQLRLILSNIFPSLLAEEDEWTQRAFRGCLCMYIRIVF